MTPCILPRHPRFKDETNKKYGRLTVLTFIRLIPKRGAVWLCQCECGQTKEILGELLRNGRTQSCGCLWRERPGGTPPTHGMSGTPTYVTWRSMIQRCGSPGHAAYHRYGARGIKVCRRWRKFENFFKDMGARPSSGHQIDRIDPKKGYSPDNCQWIHYLENLARRRAKYIRVTYRGEEDLLMNWRTRLNLNYNMVRQRLRKGWSAERAFETPNLCPRRNTSTN